MRRFLWLFLAFVLIDASAALRTPIAEFPYDIGWRVLRAAMVVSAFYIFAIKVLDNER